MTKGAAAGLRPGVAEQDRTVASQARPPPTGGSATGKQRTLLTQHQDKAFINRTLEELRGKEACPRAHSRQAASPHDALHSPAPGASLLHSRQAGGADLVHALGVFQPGEVHLLHVTGAASTFATWEGGRWPRRPAAPVEHLDVMWGQEP